MPDGQPLVWAMNLLGQNLTSRVYGPDLMERACARAARSGQRFYLYGGRNQGALVELARMLRLRHPDLQIVGGYAPPFRALGDEEEAAVAADIERCRPDVVWVGHRRAQAGEVDGAHARPPVRARADRRRRRVRLPRRAGPAGARLDAALGLEWAFRLAQEPRRLWRRYLRYNPRFVAGFARQYVRHVRTRRR